MRYLLNIVLILLLISEHGSGQLLPNLGGQRAGISNLQFMKIGVGGRGGAMGEAMVALANDASALYWNPAGLTLSASNSIQLSHSEWLVGMKHDFAGAVYRLSQSDVIGVSIISLRSDDMEITTETNPAGTGTYFQYGDLAVGISYGRKMTNQFSFGTTLRYVEENLDLVKIKAVLFDLGTYYTLGIGSLRFGVVVSNFGSDVAPQGDVTLLDGSTVHTYQSFSPPTVFKIGIALEPYQDESHRFTTSIQLNHPNDNAENLRLGIEYGWNEWLFLRAGIKRTIGEPLLGIDRKSSDDYSFGTGFTTSLGFTSITFDYGYTHYTQLGAVHRITVGFTY
ncbi:MAG: PorV/PorQ family protein [bacterium]